MSFPEKSFEQRALAWAVLGSLLIHALALLVPHQPPEGHDATASRLEARLRQQRTEPDRAPSPARSAPVSPRQKATRAEPRSRLMVSRASAAPTWTAAEKAEMDGFLDDLAEQAKSKPKASLAQRSLAMAREYGQQLAQQDADRSAVLELRANSPPVNPFSLEMYLDALIRRLNRSAKFAQNDPRAKGVHPAAVQFRLNPDGSLKSFDVLNAADQAAEIAFIKSVVERAVPFSPFPPDIDRAARSLGVTICIRPGQGDSGPGFSRTDGRSC